jgi:hypothetical protein
VAARRGASTLPGILPGIGLEKSNRAGLARRLIHGRKRSASLTKAPLKRFIKWLCQLGYGAGLIFRSM